MKVTLDDLESRMALLPDATLNAIICAPGSQYTEDAREAALRVLGRRGGNAPVDPPGDASPQVSYAIEDAIAKRLGLWESIRSDIEHWKEHVLPPAIPLRIRDLFWVGITSALPALAVVVGSLRTTTDAALIAHQLTTLSSLGILAVGVSGLTLSYGILTERMYPRFFAVPFVALTALWPLRRRRRDEDESTFEYSACFVWSYQTIKYLLKSSESSAYYDSLRCRSLSRGATASIPQTAA